MDTQHVTLWVVEGTYAVCRLERLAELPVWAMRSNLLSITRTADELSVVCDQSEVPDSIKCERDWKCLKVAGPLNFELTGVLASLASPLAEADVSIFAISTYETDYLLVKEDKLALALEALRATGHQIEEG